MKSRWMGPLIQEICGESISLGESVVKIRISVPSFFQSNGCGKMEFKQGDPGSPGRWNSTATDTSGERLDVSNPV